MGKLIVVVGSTGVGKTTLTRLLCQETGYSSGLEDHAGRPFQALFKSDFRYALPNQLDYLLFRMEQEAVIRAADQHGILDGGLEMDFYGFTRLFHARGWLSNEDYDLCNQLYTLARSLLPPPECIIHLTAPARVISGRLADRERINIASTEDSTRLDRFLMDWLSTVDPACILEVDTSQVDPSYHNIIPGLVNSMNLCLAR